MLRERVLQTIQRRRLLAAGARGLLAFSGGPDSLCLLHLLAGLRGELGLDLRAVHVDHGLRPESAAEAERAAELAEAAGVPLQIRQARLQPQPGRNLQEAARLARRGLLQDEARRQEAGWVAIAHTASDQAETVLMRLLRGCGPAGLAGISYRSGLFVRPLLGVSRKEVEDYLGKHQLKPLQDPSNGTPRFLRNRLRQQVLPLLEQENPALLTAIGRLAESCREEDQALEQLAAEQLARARRGRALQLEPLADLPRGLLHRVLRRAYAEATGSTRRLERSHLEALAAMALDPVGHGSCGLDLPGLRVERRYRQLSFGEEVTAAPLGETLWPSPGSLSLADGRQLELLRLEAGQGDPEGPAALARLDPVRLSFPLTVRAVRPGDRISIGPQRSRKVARLLVDAKIPRRERGSVPLLAAGGEVMVVVGVRCAFGLEAGRGAPCYLLRWSGPGSTLAGAGPVDRI